MNFKDLFSTQASAYAQYRPHYPQELFDYLASICEEKNLVWDCGAGNGQASVQIANYFEKVFATDPSEKQIANAVQKNNIQYQVGSAEKCSLPDKSADLITVAQAFHWFKFDAFFSEVKRILKPNGVIAIWTYGNSKVSYEVDRLVFELYENILGSYWEKERKLVEEGYTSCPFPFEKIKTPEFNIVEKWTAEQFIGYLSTWSALQTYIKKNGTNPLEEMAPAIMLAWENDDPKNVRWPLSLKVGRA